ncbi:MAG: DUF6265 family protein [Phycisphaerales bacterium]
MKTVSTVCGIGLLAACGLGAWAGVQAAAAPSQTAEASAPRAHTLADCVFLAGAWKGAMGEDRAEEHWSAPDGTSILGMFRWINADGSPSMFEVLTITEEEGKVFLRLRHFDAKLQPWASETVPTTLKLAEASASKVVFRGIESEKKLAAVTYHCPAPDELRILVEFPGEGREPLNFTMKRVAAGAK